VATDLRRGSNMAFSPRTVDIVSDPIVSHMTFRRDSP
jgi:hypothetical protein